jgi:hypothetical protein
MLFYKNENKPRVFHLFEAHVVTCEHTHALTHARTRTTRVRKRGDASGSGKNI